SDRKQYLQTMYDDAMDAIHQHLIKKSGSMMLGATTSGAAVQPVSIPPLQREFTPNGQRDWDSGVALVKTCMDTHDTATGLAPEIAHFRMPGDEMEERALTGSGEATVPGEFPPYDARYILR
ncbi:hypothetical protein MPER_06043, partial [Moniliophthora perniciosa FA553]